jgi:hypothetical protein
MTYSAFAGGTQLTTAMPTSGTKTYTGKMTGVLANSPLGGSDDVSGNVSLTVDFANGTITGGFPGGLLTNNVVTAPGVSTVNPLITTYTVYAPLQSLPNPLFGDIAVASGGSITGNGFSTALSTLSIPLATTMTMKGNFYGATANEIAGTLTISVPTGPGLKLIGSFGAK